MKLADLSTPALLLERGVLARNAARMGDALAQRGVPLRLHVKTVKSVDAVRFALGSATAPIAVSTLREAEHFLAHGFRDLVYAVGLAPGKFERVAGLVDAGARPIVLLDDRELAREWIRFCRGRGLEIPTLIEIDTDGRRAGLAPGAPVLTELAADLEAAGLFEGLLTHAGGSYAARSVEGIKDSARRERDGIVHAAERLRAAGLPVPVVSLGSTPTALFGESFDGVTEVRAGVFLCMDLVMAGLSVCEPGDIALSVLTSVIGHRAAEGRLILDAGWMALSRDRGAGDPARDLGYGVVCDAAGRPLEDVVVVETNQEHGIAAARSGPPLDVRRFPVGTRLRILPIHACATAAQHAEFAVLDGGDEVLARWPRVQGW